MRCICTEHRTACTCPSPVQKCLVLGCYLPGAVEHWDPKLGWLWCEIHYECETAVRAARARRDAKLLAAKAARS